MIVMPPAPAVRARTGYAKAVGCGFRRTALSDAPRADERGRRTVFLAGFGVTN